jgi:hypothetical protein
VGYPYLRFIFDSRRNISIEGDSADGTALRSGGNSSSLAETLESSRNIPYLQITPQGEIAKCNPATLFQLRLTEVQVIGMMIWDFLTARDSEWMRSCITTLERGHNGKHLLNFVDIHPPPFSRTYRERPGKGIFAPGRTRD